MGVHMRDRVDECYSVKRNRWMAQREENVNKVGGGRGMDSCVGGVQGGVRRGDCGDRGGVSRSADALICMIIHFLMFGHDRLVPPTGFLHFPFSSQ